LGGSASGDAITAFIASPAQFIKAAGTAARCSVTEFTLPSDAEFTQHGRASRRCLIASRIDDGRSSDMIKQLLGGAAMTALMMGIAYGQTTLESTTTRTTVVPPVPPPPVAGYSDSRTERTTFGGASTEIRQNYRTGPEGTEATKQETLVHPNGASETEMQSQRSSPPPAAPLPPPVGTINTTTSATTSTTTTTR
jgi:hypothetical protein